MPILRMIRSTRKPGMSGRMMNAVGRWTVLPPRSTSVCANVAMTPARCPLPIHSFRPSRIQCDPSALSRAVVLMCCASDPSLGLGERVRGQRLPASEHRQVARFLLGVAKQHDCFRAKPAVHADEDSDRRVSPRELAKDARVAGARESQAAILLGNREAEKARCAQVRARRLRRSSPLRRTARSR